MSFLGKMKTGFSQVKDKAQHTVESTRLSAHISSKKKEISSIQQKLGELVYKKYSTGDESIGSLEFKTFCESIDTFKGEIKQLEIELLKSEEKCTATAE